jgi:hypothetical protein
MKLKTNPSSDSEVAREGVAVVTEAQVKSALSRTQLTHEEEKVVRLRRGVSVDLKAPLPKAASENSELEDELMLLEFQLFKAMKAKAAAAKGAAQTDSAKSKIVSALSKKKP